MSAVSHSRHVCRLTQQTCLLCHTADISVASHSRHVCCVTSFTPLKTSDYFLSGFREQPSVDDSPSLINAVSGSTRLVHSRHLGALFGQPPSPPGKRFSNVPVDRLDSAVCTGLMKPFLFWWCLAPKSRCCFGLMKQSVFSWYTMSKSWFGSAA